MKTVVLDIETTGLDPFHSDLLCVGLGSKVHTPEVGLRHAQVILSRPGTAVISHTTFDVRYLLLKGLALGPGVQIWDTKVMAWLLDGTQPLDLESLTERYCGYTPNKRLRQVAKRVMFRRDCSWCDSEGCSLCSDPKALVPIEEAPWDELATYNASDLRAENDLFQQLRGELQRQGLWRQFLAEEVGFTRLLCEVEATGMPFDAKAAKVKLALTEADMASRAEWLVNVTGAPGFNLASGDQVARFLYTEAWEQDVRFDIPRLVGMPKEDKLEAVQKIAPPGVRVVRVGSDYAYGTVLLDGMGLRPPKRDRKQKTSRPSVSGNKLAVLYSGNPWIDEFVAWKKLEKLGGYLRDWIERAHEGNLYGRFDQSGTATGRLAAREPNLQQVAKESDIRDLFRGDDLVIGDYSMLEARLAGHFSHDPVMLDIFANGIDLYGKLASEAWGGEPTKENPRRGLMKTVYLGSQYGAAGETLAFVMALAGIPGVTPAKADAFLHDLKNTLPRMFKWRQEVIAQAEKDGYVETLAGRRRRLVGIKSADWKKKGTAERQAVSTKVQGSAADIVRRAMLAARAAVAPEAARICLQVHDEILWRRGPEWEDDVFPRLVDICQYGHGFELDVPLIFEAKLASSWGEKGDAIPAGAYEHLTEGVSV